MRLAAIAVLVFSLAACSSGGSNSSSGSTGTSGGSSTSTTNSSSTGTTTSTSSGSTGSGSSSGSSGSTGGPAPTVTVTSPAEGACVSFQGQQQIALTATNFQLTLQGCNGNPACGEALVSLAGPNGSCDNPGGAFPNAGTGVSPVVISPNCAPVLGPSGPRQPPGTYTASIYLLQTGSPQTLVTAPDGGPFAQVSFVMTYNEGFRCGDDPEVVMEQDISQRIDGVEAVGGTVYVANNAGGNGSVVAVPEGAQAVGGDAGAQVLVPTTTGLWASSVRAHGGYVFVGANNVPYDMYAALIAGGPLFSVTADAGLSGAGGPCIGENASGVFFTTGAGIAQSDGAQTTLITNAGGGCVAADDSNVYFIDNSGGISSAPIATGTPVTSLAANQSGVRDVFVDGQNVYWSLPGLGGAQGAIRAVDKTGAADGGWFTVAGSLVGPTQILSDAQDGGTVMYWADGQGISRLDPSGTKSMISTAYTNRTGSSYTFLSIDGDYLYFADDAHVFRAKK